MKSIQKYIFTLFSVNIFAQTNPPSGLVQIADEDTDLTCNTADLQSEIKISYITAGDGAHFSPYGGAVVDGTSANINSVNAAACTAMTFDTTSDNHFIVKVPESCMLDNGQGYGTSGWTGSIDSLVVGLTIGATDTVVTDGTNSVLVEKFAINFQCSFNDTYYLKADIGQVTTKATTLQGVNADSKYNFKMVIGTDKVTNFPAIAPLTVDTLTAGSPVHAVIYADNTETDKFPVFTAAPGGLQFVPQNCVYGVVDGDYDWASTSWVTDASVTMCSPASPMPKNSVSLANHLQYSLDFSMASNAWTMTFNTFLFSTHVNSAYTLMCTVKVCDDAIASNDCDTFVSAINTQPNYVGSGVAASGLFT